MSKPDVWNIVYNRSTGHTGIVVGTSCSMQDGFKITVQYGEHSYPYVTADDDHLRITLNFDDAYAHRNDDYHYSVFDVIAESPEKWEGFPGYPTTENGAGVPNDRENDITDERISAGADILHALLDFGFTGAIRRARVFLPDATSREELLRLSLVRMFTKEGYGFEKAVSSARHWMDYEKRH